MRYDERIICASKYIVEKIKVRLDTDVKRSLHPRKDGDDPDTSGYS